MKASRRFVVSIDDQTLRLVIDGECMREFPVSTSIKGMGFVKDSYRTPVGNFRICEKIGAGQPAGTVFKARVPVGQWHPGESPEADLVLTRILRLDGLDPDNANTLERCVYIHGTNREDLIGQPAGNGCVRMRNADMMELYDLVEENDLLEIMPATLRRGRLLFINLEPLLLSLDSILEMARLRGAEIHHEVERIITARDEGIIAHGDAFKRSMDLISPDRGLCEAVAEICAAAVCPAVADFISAIRETGWLVVIVSSSPAQIAAVVARKLGVLHHEAPSLVFHDDGSYAGSGNGYPLIGNFEQSHVIRDWISSLLPERVVILSKAALNDEIHSMAEVIVAGDEASDCDEESFGRVLKALV